MKEEIKKLLEPHYGHLNFLMKIKRDEVSIDDISNLIELINDKNLVSNLPKNLHSYNSYYMLMKDFFFVKRNITLIKTLKENLTSVPKSIVIGLLTEVGIPRKLNKILNDEELSKEFFRWSSRINDSEFARFYINSFSSNSNVWLTLNAEKSNLIELKNFEKHSKFIPSSWCIKNKKTFYQYLRKQRIFVLKHQGKIYGVNLRDNSRGLYTDVYANYYTEPRNKFDLNNITIQNQNNKNVSFGDPIFEVAKSELIKMNLFGINKESEKTSDKKISNQKGTTRQVVGIFRRFFNIFGFVGPH